jgi:hypothetical protein
MRLQDEAAKRPPAQDRSTGDRPLTQRDRQHMTDRPKGAAPAKVPDSALAAAFSKAGFTIRK